MLTKRYKPEQIVNLLRQVEVEIANGKTTPQACRDAGITAQTYYLYGLLPVLQEESRAWRTRAVAHLYPASAGTTGSPCAPQWDIRTNTPHPLVGPLGATIEVRFRVRRSHLCCHCLDLLRKR